MSFAIQYEDCTTCMYVRLLGPCYKTGEKLCSYTLLMPPMIDIIAYRSICKLVNEMHDTLQITANPA